MKKQNKKTHHKNNKIGLTKLFFIATAVAVLAFIFEAYALDSISGWSGTFGREILITVSCGLGGAVLFGYGFLLASRAKKEMWLVINAVALSLIAVWSFLLLYIFYAFKDL